MLLLQRLQIHMLSMRITFSILSLQRSIRSILSCLIFLRLNLLHLMLFHFFSSHRISWDNRSFSISIKSKSPNWERNRDPSLIKSTLNLLNNFRFNIYPFIFRLYPKPNLEINATICKFIQNNCRSRLLHNTRMCMQNSQHHISSFFQISPILHTNRHFNTTERICRIARNLICK